MPISHSDLPPSFNSPPPRPSPASGGRSRRVAAPAMPPFARARADPFPAPPRRIAAPYCWPATDNAAIHTHHTHPGIVLLPAASANPMSSSSSAPHAIHVHAPASQPASLGVQHAERVGRQSRRVVRRLRLFGVRGVFRVEVLPARHPNATLYVWAIFAMTFLMRPIGAWYFGRFADRHGRRLALTVSVT